MRKLIVQEMVSLDGYFAGPQGEIDWHQADEDYVAYAKSFLQSVDLLLFGRLTYEQMAAFWPSANHELASIMNEREKIVFSNTLVSANWRHSRLVPEHAIEEVKRLKREAGQNMAVLGSGSLASSLLCGGLVDEIQLTVVPIMLGQGIPLFRDIPSPLRLQLEHTDSYPSGNVLLRYLVDRGPGDGA
ncbi:dihydrofolate reductase [Paenibacillus sp. 1011MAR3C5]|uniref:dihydrofolate reductase family protein n=1 Tax=Paenibacillus sp. 1011MAR3C5 TaxID=1675787 RepID=UPI000E6B7853|nr:dihydrofolate reductase family protein [Paenibacillus sp. 1011MAR3C5]RJE88447.1 dihydrofolate reductase [Paenibacillus sp. 1011MAR3C5]